MADYLTVEHIEELRKRARLQGMYTRMSDRGQIKWMPFPPSTGMCAECGANHTKGVRDDGKEVVLPISLSKVEGEWLCRHCFANKWIAMGCAHPGHGTPAPATPVSQEVYNGSDRYSGEW